jgi:L-iditol 2-dehydrogenase
VFLGLDPHLRPVPPVLDGRQNLCEHHLLYGYDPFPGAYAELAAVPPIAVKNLIPLPPDLPSELATVVDPFACALNGIEVLDVGLGDTVLILGAGPDRLLAGGHGPRPRGRPVFLSDVNRQRLDLALAAVGGFVDDAWVAGDDNGLAEVLERTGGPGPTGSAWPPPPSRPSRRPWRWRPSGPGSSTSPACPSTTR